MQKETISSGQAFSLIALYIMGSSITTGIAGEAQNNSWAAILIAIVAALPLILLNIKLITSFPGKNLFEILEIVLGKFFGRLIIAFYSWYALHLGALVLSSFKFFVHTAALPETPTIVVSLLMTVLGIWLSRAGVEVMARSAKMMITIDYTVITMVFLLSLPQLNPDYLLPIFGSDMKPILSAAFSAFSYPFAETFMLSIVVFSFEHKKDVKKAYLGGYLIAGLFIIALGTRNIAMMGVPVNQVEYFPSYAAVSRIRVGDFIQRIEGTVDIVFQTMALFEYSICLVAFTKGIAHLLKIENYRVVALPAGLIMLCFDQLQFNSILEMREFDTEIYPYYALPFQVIFPAIIFLAYLIRKRRGSLRIQSS